MHSPTHGSEPHHVLDFGNALEVAADILHVTHIMHTEAYLTLKDAVMRIHIEVLYVHVKLLRKHTGNLMEHSHVVNAIDVDGGGKKEFLVPQLAAKIWLPSLAFSLAATGHCLLCMVMLVFPSKYPSTSSPGIGWQQLHMI